MHILVLGAAGMVGRKLCERLLRDGQLGKSDITKLTMHDVVAPAKPEKAGFPVNVAAGDFAVPGAAEKLIVGRPDVIFHLAAIVSGEAELDFDKGYRINLDGTRMLLDAIGASAPPTSLASYSPPRLRCSARPFPRRSEMSSSTRRF